MAVDQYYFYAVTKVQFRYFQSVNNYLRQPEKCVFYNKKTNFPVFVKVPLQRLSAIADIAVATKMNSAKYRCKSTLYFKLYKIVKLIDASWRYACYSRALRGRKVKKLIVWNGLKYNQLIIRLVAKDYNTSVIFMENGLVPGMTTIDKKGVNYGNSAPRDVNFYLSLGKGHNSTKKTVVEPPYAKYIFVPFQVNTDSQIVSYSPWIKSMHDLFSFVVKASESLPSGYKVVFRCHPMCPEDYSDLMFKSTENDHIIFDNESSVCTLIENASAICTINSTVGIEGLLNEKKVIVLGDAFYAIEGLTKSAKNMDELISSFKEIDCVELDSKAISGFKKYLTDIYQVYGNWADADEAHFASLKEKLDRLSYDATNQY